MEIAAALRVSERQESPGVKPGLFVKRGVDFTFSLILAFLIAPLLLLLFVLIKLESRGPALYRQQRIGYKNCRFQVWKFRSMVPDADRILSEYLADDREGAREWAQTHKLKNDPRVTRVGRLLRRTSLDELPQLWNVLKGDMSLIGPRPIVAAEVPKYRDRIRLYTQVRPGVTGLWQVSGRNDTTYEERVELDSYYVRNWSPWLDVRILIKTVRVVLLGEGAY